MKYIISGSDRPAKKGKAITFGFKPFVTKSDAKFIEYINSHATIPCEVENGHRKTDNITKIYPWFRLDIDKKSEIKKVEKRLKKMNTYYIKKPSTRNDKFPYKWHIFVPIDGVAQNYDEYKLQYYKFLSDHKIELEDKSLASVVQNTNFMDSKKAIKLTSLHKGNTYVAQKMKVPKKPKLERKSSETSKEDVKRMLSKINVNKTVYKADVNSDDIGWWNVGNALYDWCPKRGLKLWTKWSKTHKDFNEKEIYEKWADFANNRSGDISIGTLNHYAYGEAADPADAFRKEDGSVHPMSKKEKKKAKKKRKKMTLDDILDELSDPSLLAVPKDLKVIKGTHGRFYHGGLHVIHGLAKSGKTFLALETLETAKETKKVIWIDGDNNPKSMVNKFNHVVHLPPLNKDKYLDKWISFGQKLKGVVFIIDSLKNFTNGNDMDTNSGSVAIMERFNQLANFGATVILIHHSSPSYNKEGVITGIKIKANSESIYGACDIAYLFERNPSTGASALTTERSRIEERPQGDVEQIGETKGFKTKSDVLSDAEMKVIKDKKAKQLKHDELKDSGDIKIIKRVINDLNDGKNKYVKPYKSTIIAELKQRESFTDKKTKDLLRDYNNVHWEYEVDTESLNAQKDLYKVIKKISQEKETAIQKLDRLKKSAACMG